MMNPKNTFLYILLIGMIGIIFFKILFAFILPIILFVVLMSILKVLIKGFDEDKDTTNPELINNNPNGNSVENIVTITLEE